MNRAHRRNQKVRRQKVEPSFRVSEAAGSRVAFQFQIRMEGKTPSQEARLECFRYSVTGSVGTGTDQDRYNLDG